MKNFTKQNFKTNPLWIRLLIMTFMVLLSTGSAWGAYNQSAVDLYFDDSEAKWSDNSKSPYVYIGHSTWTTCYGPMTRVAGTQYLFILKKANFNGGSTWNNATGWVICNEKWWDGNGESIDKFTWHGDKNVTQKRTSAWSASNVYKTNGTASTTSDNHTIQAYKTTTYSNKNYTVTISSVTGGTLTVKDYDNTTVSNGASKIVLTVLKFSASASSGYTFKEVQINDGSTTTTIAAANLSTTYTLKSNVTITPVWEKSCTTVKAPVVTADAICAGNTATLKLTNRQADVTYKLNSTSGTTIFSSADTYTTSALNANTTYKIYASHASACTNNVEGSVTVTVNPKPAIELTSSSAIICNGDEITLANYVKSSTGTVKWYTNEGMTTEAAAKVKPTANTTYYAKATSGDCAAETAQLKVTVNDKPATPTLTPATVSLVSPETATLTAGNTTNGLTYTLYNGETAGESKKSTGSDLTFTVSAAGSYTVRVTNDCGTSVSTPAVTVTVCTPQVNEFKHANSSYTQLANQPTYYPGDKAYFVSIYSCCLTGTWSNNLQKGEEAWYAGLTGGTPKFSMTLTRAGNFTITNNATNGCTDTKDVMVNLDFKVTALPEVTNTNGTASGSNIALTWKHATSHTNVMVVRYPTSGTETIPAGGQAYTAGTTLGDGKVVYVGTAESFTDTNLAAGAGYKYYFYTVNNNYYSEGVVLNMSSCAIPAKPQLSSTPVTACGGTCTTQGYIIIGNMSDYKDDTYTFQLGNGTVTPTAEGKLGINSTAYTQYTVTVTNSCGNSSNAQVNIAINDNKPTITGATYTQPGKDNAIELTLPAGISAKWTTTGGDLSVSEGNSTMFSAEENGTYTITADNGGCTDTHVVTVSDAFYVYMRQPKKGETAYDNFYYPTQNPTQGGDLFYKEYASIPPAEGYTDYNTGGVAHDIIFTDCDGYVWYGFKASDKLIDGTNYFTVRAPNLGGNGGYYTHTYLTKPGAMTSDIYYTMSEEASGNSRGWYITKVSAPYAGPVVHATDASFNKNNFAEFAALYVTDCSGKELKSYQWQYSATENGEYADYSSVCTYVGKKTEQGDAGKTNNIRPNVAGWYRCTATYNDDSYATSAALEVKATSGTTKADFNSNLPVIMVNTGSKDFPSCPVSGETASKNAEKMKKKLSVDVKILHDGNIVYDRKARMAYRGSSSLNFQKKSYAFCPGDANCGDADKGEDYVKTAKLNMLGIGEAYDKDWVLYAAAADPSMLRNRMVFETYQAMRPGDWGVHSRYVELIINGEYKGVYVMMDKITQNKNRVNVEWDVKDASKRGFILKFDKTDIADRSFDYPDGDEKTFLSKYSGKYDIGTYDTTNDQAFEIEYPEKEDIQDDGGNWYEVINFIKGMVNDFETALATGDYAKVQQIIDYESWADWFILSEYTKNVDAFRASCVFVYDGNKIKATPLWDQELSFNNQSVHANRHIGDGGNKGCQDATGLLIKHSGVYSDNFAAPFWFTGQLAGGKGTEKLAAKTFTGALLNDQCFVQMVKNRWAAHKEGALSNASLTALITEYEKELTEAVRTREANFWTNNGYSRNTLSCPWGGNSTGYYDDSYTDAKADITNWISDNNASISGTGRRKGLDAVISALEGTGLDISISPASIETTPWVPVVLQVHNESGYEYTLTYTDRSLDQVKDLIIERSGDTYKYHIPRPAAWGTGNEDVEGEREDISYGIKATLQIGDANNQCGTSGELPSAAATIILQDEDNDDCPQP